MTLNRGLWSSRFAFAPVRVLRAPGRRREAHGVHGRDLGIPRRAEAELETFRRRRTRVETTDAFSAASDSEASDSGASDASYDDVEESVARDAALLDLDANVGKVWDALPSGSMLPAGHGRGERAVKIMQERSGNARRRWTVGEVDGRSGGWSPAEAERARRGMLFAAVKNDDDGDANGCANAGDADDGTR